MKILKSVAAPLARWGLVVAVAGVGPALSAASASAAGVQYAAIAVSESTGATGSAWNRSSPEEAENDAIAACNQENPPVFHPATGSSAAYTSGGDCGWEVEIPSGYCAAVVQSDSYDSAGDYRGHYYSSAWGQTRQEADYNAIQKGTGHGSQILTSVCQD
jgi:hypothetical protein